MLHRGPSTLANSPAHISSNWPLETQVQRLFLDRHTHSYTVSQADGCWVTWMDRWMDFWNCIHLKLQLYFHLTCSVCRKHRCHSWNTRCREAGQRSWRSSASLASHTPDRVAPVLEVWIWRLSCTSYWTLRRSASPGCHQSPSRPALDQRQWPGSNSGGRFRLERWQIIINIYN